jgi:adenylate cyclase
MPSLQLLVHEGDALRLQTDFRGPLELGRQRSSEPEPSEQTPCPLLPASASGPARLIVAGNRESNVSRQHALLEPLPSGLVRVHNLTQIPLVHDHGILAPGTSADLPPPFSLDLPPRRISIVPAAYDSADEHGVKGLEEQTIGPGPLSELSVRLRQPPPLPPEQLNQMLSWLQSTIGVLQAAVGSPGFLRQAAEALVEVVGLSSGRVLLFDTEPFSVAAIYPPAAAGRPWQPSQHVLNRLRRERRTFWQEPTQGRDPDPPSLLGLHAVVASPLLDRSGRVIGALYGERREELPFSRPRSARLEATLAELLACGVSTGLAREEYEKAALAARVQFEQFFTPQLARHLAADPGLLRGAEREVTLLFCDVRSFSAFSERLGPEKTVEWINDVMSTLSECVLAEEGVLVDYIGDEMLAMWGAPLSQPDQAERGVRAALAMIGRLPALDARWHPTLGGTMSFGIGMNTGVARVGNTGSRFKFKYGPLGNTVNLASRVQGLTKYLKSRLLVTRATREKLSGEFVARRVVKTRVVNIHEPVDLYEVERAGCSLVAEFYAGSEAALDALEAGNFADAARRAGTLLPAHHDDGPLQLVLSRASQMLIQGGDGFDLVWEPPGK